MLELRNITKDYKVGDEVVHALKGVSLAFRETELVSVLGQSGCGKSTLLNIIGGLDHYTNGDLIIGGRSTKEFKDADWDFYRNHRIGFIFQSYNLIPHQTILSNVELALNIAGVPREERLKRSRAALDSVGLAGQYNKKPNQLSGGQMQRVAIARALVNNPDILLADEPTGALDSETSVQIMDIIHKLSEKCLVIMVTHNPELAEKYSSRIIRLHDGEVVSDSAPFEASGDEAANREAAAADGEKEQDSLDPSAAQTEKDDAPAEKKTRKSKKSKEKRKAKLSFWSAFKLSGKNLLSKLKRTILVCVAGSIGIVGVATVLAVSSGVTNFITDMQNDMLSGNPISIDEEAFDLSAAIDSMSTSEQSQAVKDSIEDGYINIDKVVDRLVESAGQTDALKIKNDISNDYLEFVRQMPEEYYKAIATYYGVNLSNNLYTDYVYNVSDGNGGVKEVTRKVSLTAATQMYLSMLQKTEKADFAVYIDMVSSSFIQSPGDEDFILSQYDIISDPATSKIASEANEIMIVVDDDTQLSDLMLAQFGYFTQDQFFNICYRAMGDERYDEEMYKGKLSYAELMGKTFTWYPNNEIFDLSGLSATNIRVPYRPYADDDWQNGIDLKITAILRPKANLSYGSLSSGFYYTPALTAKIIEINSKSDIVVGVKNYLKSDVITSLAIEHEGSTIYQGITYDYDYYFEGQEYNEVGFVGERQSLLSIIGSFIGGLNVPETYTLSLRALGGVDVPNRIAIYPTDFEYKDNVTAYLNTWNGTGEIKVGDKTIAASDRKEIRYTDNLSLIIDMINGMIKIITIALVAFTALSLVVSTVMIAIITYVSVMERIKEIGVIRSLGGRKRDVSALFNAETFIIGAISGVFGIAITYLIQVIMNASLGHAFGISTIAALPIPTALIMIAVSIILTLVSGLIPAALAAKKDPVVALRSE